MNIGPCVYPRCNDGQGNPVLTTIGICEGCRFRYGRLIDWVREDYVVLSTTLPSPVRRGARVRSSARMEFGHPAEWASDEAHAIATIIGHAEDAIREWRGDARKSSRIAERRLVFRGFTYVLNHFEDLCVFPAAGAVAEALVKKHGQIRAGLGHTRQLDRLPTPCPRCVQVELVSHGGRGDRVIECENCGHRVRPEHYDYLTRFAVGVAQSEDDEMLAEYDEQMKEDAQ